MIFLKIALTLAICAAIFWQIDMAQMISNLRKLSPGALAVPFALFVLHVAIGGLRWQFVLRKLGFPLGFGPILRGLCLERFLNQGLPGMVGGEAARVALIHRVQVPLRAAAASIVVDRGTAVVALGILILLGAPALHALASWHPMAIVIWTAAGIVIGGWLLVSVLSASFLHRVLQFARLGRLAGFAVMSQQALRSFRTVGPAVLMSMAVHLALIVAFVQIAKGLNLRFDLMQGLALLPPVFFAMLLPISVNGWGVREGASIVFLGFAGLSAEDSVIASVLFGLNGVGIGLLGGVVWLLTRSKPLSS